MSVAAAIVDRLLEANSRGLPPPVEAELREIHAGLGEAADKLRRLTPRAGLDERDEAVEFLGGAAERLDNIVLNYQLQDFPAIDWVLADIGACRDDLLELLNQDSFASAEDAASVQRVVDKLENLLK